MLLNSHHSLQIQHYLPDKARKMMMRCAHLLLKKKPNLSVIIAYILRQVQQLG